MKDQVKVRGSSVELGEVEAALLRHPDVQAAAVVAAAAPVGMPELAAYVVVRTGGQLDLGALRQQLAQDLPDPMIPAFFTVLEKLPLEAGGKLDRQALAMMAEQRLAVSTDRAAPRTLIEKALAMIWKEVLWLSKVGIHDNFFDLGGHSLTATQVVSRLRQTFGVDATVGMVFEFPTVAELAQRIDQMLIDLSPPKKSLLEPWPQSPGRVVPPQQVIPRLAERNGLPLSFAQERLWFLDEYEPGSTAYNLPLAYHLAGPLDVAALQHALEEIVRRHEILRTTLRLLEGKAIQVIACAAPVALPVVDLAQMAQPQQAQALHQAIAKDLQVPFDLSAGPVFWAKLIRLGSEEHLLLLNFHHAFCDGWSLEVFGRELSLLYADGRAGRPASLPELPVQYADYAVWQRQWLQGPELERQLQYWRQQLAHAPALELPADHPRPPRQTYVGARHVFHLPPELAVKLRTFNQRRGATPFMTLLGMFQVLLSRYSGQEDILVGIPIANRQQVELEGLIGFFVNTLVLRGDLSGEPDFGEVVARVRRAALDAFQHQDLPFEKLVVELEPVRDLSRHPLFQVMFAVQNAPEHPLALAGLEVSPEPLPQDTTHFDLELRFWEQEDRWQGVFLYNTDLFHPATIARMAGHYLELLGHALAEPEQPVSQWPMLSAAERHQLLVEWNNTAADYPRDKCVHQLFEEQVERTPEAVAVVFEEQQLTYLELNDRANQLAWRLCDVGIGPDVLVGICLERSLEMVVALLAVLKAGGAFVPIEPSHPIKRIQAILQDAAVAAMVVHRRLPLDLDEGVVGRIYVDEWMADRDRVRGRNPKIAVLPQQPAYAIYTSGSSGQPKGVLVSQEAFLCHCHGIARHYQLSARDRVLQFASFSFDAALEQVFPPLLAGATVVLRDGEVWPPVEFGRRIEALAISVVNLPPAYWHQWLLATLELPDPPVLDHLRLVICGGDVMPAEGWPLWRQTPMRNVRLLNAYGPTETTITATTCEVSQAVMEERAGRRIPIGRPLSNRTIYLLDRRLRAVPVGVPGELYIGGPTVALSYLRQPDLTLEKFIPHPLGTTQAGRLYRTGDVARYLPDGAIEYLGRADDQLKIRGFRIEPAEIESALNACPLVKQSVVVSRPGPDGTPELVAYYLPRPADNQPELWPCPGDYRLFDEVMYYAMTHDEVRNRAYRAALDRVVKGKVVVDIGTGKDVIWGRYCVQAGAQKVYAIEVLEGPFRQAQALVHRLGLEDRITLVHGDSLAVQLPELVDVCVSELIGVIGSSEGAVDILNNAKRFLKPDAVMIPRSCRTLLAGVSLPDELAAAPAFGELPGQYVEAIFKQVRTRFDLRVGIKHFPRTHLLSEPAVFEELDFSAPMAAEWARPIQLRVRRAGRLDGFLLWLNLFVSETEVIDSFDGTAWLPVFFPVFSPGIEVADGDILECTCWAKPGKDGSNPDYGIRGVLRGQCGVATSFDYESALYSNRLGSGAFYKKLFAAEPFSTRRKELADSPLHSLRKHLEGLLPEHLIPSVFLRLKELPLTASGKVDRRALVKMEGQKLAVCSAHVAPRNLLEEQLAAIWKEVLGLSDLGIHESFFELGGHSLLAMQVMARLGKVLGVSLQVRNLFEAPTIGSLAQQLSRANAVALPPLEPAPRIGPPPLSFAQERLWFLDEYEPGSTAYNLPLAYHLAGPLDVPALQHALEEIVRRHEILRTTLRLLEGKAIQVIACAAPVALPVVDLAQMAQPQQAQALHQAIAKDLQVPFDLSAGPVFWAKLIRLGSEEHLLLLNFHHAFCDGWSLEVFGRELSLLYADGQAGRPASLPELPVQYADYAVWQRQWLQGPELERQLQYWRQQLAHAPALELPADHPRPPRQTYVGARHVFHLPPELAVKLRTFNQRRGATPFMTLLGMFQVLLSRYSGQEDILVGIPIANRQQVELEELIGFFVNTLVLRGDLSGTPGFHEVVDRVRRAALDAFQHQDLPFEKLVGEINPARDLSRHPLFQVIFAVQNAPEHRVALAGLDVTPHPLPQDTTHFDLELHFSEQGNRWQGVFLYNTDLFNPATIARMAGHYLELLGHALAEPKQPVSQLPMLSAAERHQLLVEWNDTAVDYPRDTCVHQLFEEQVERTPEAVAVVFEGQELTYRELNERANQLAHHLQRLGVGPEVLVGICLERSLEMVLGLLGILKAGGAYVPLDPTYPPERLAFMLGDAAPPVLLTQAHLPAGTPLHKTQVIRLDVDWQTIALEPRGNVPSTAGAHNLAYVIYTSGSTGRPKGAMITHVAIVNRLLWMQDACRLHQPDRVLQKTPFSFDVSAWEFFWPLITGAGLVMARPEGHKDRSYLAGLIAKEKITTIHFVPAMLQVFLEQEGLEGLCGSLKRVICSGEALSPDLQHRFFARLSADLHNLYGPTEAAVDVTAWVCKRGSLLRTVPIGRPIANIQIYVLDAQLHPRPVGVPGELHIGGIGLARGYLNRPDLTADKFIPNPFSLEPGARLYKTGDLARYLADGNLEFLGRADHQVKIRGFRIELEEIEFVLRAQTGVKDAAVVVREDTPDNKRLVACLVADEGKTLQVEELRQGLAQRLPDYMIPSSFIVLDKLPLNPSGKLDRRALAGMKGTSLAVSTPRVAPRNLIEQQLAAIWREILDLPEVSIQDNFFDLGGHSLQAIRLAAEVKKILARSLPIAAVFQFPTIESMAHMLSATEHDTGSQWASLVPLQPKGSKPPCYFFHGLTGEVFNFVDLSRLLGPDQPCYGLQAIGLDDRQPRHLCVEDMAAHYAREIQTHQPQGPYYLGGYSAGGWVAYATAQELKRQGQTVAMLALLDTHPLHPTRPLPWWVYWRAIGPHLMARFRVHVRQFCQVKGQSHWQYFLRRLAAFKHHARQNHPRPAQAAAAHPPDPSPAAPSRDFCGDALARYQPAAYHGSADYFVPEAVSLQQLAIVRYYFLRGQVNVHRLSGNHWTLMDSDHLPGLSRIFAAALRQAQERARLSHSR